ncbi:hypothetical protein N8I71_08625 [Roseibacterium sp. SDUM158016]|uniref:hypothetical protein n=1 Tax=Roseicyclus sediminis TaxID=2980997 RepID=UPI0021D2BF8C|nr:hypothetical protein [Roseibacterium sp. SDUM158016]MCU4652894.1 hypothetical protein [Roseibacterium sp. SDUM158016]
MRTLGMLTAVCLALPLSVAADTGRLSDMLQMIPDAAIPAGAPRLDIAYGDGDAVRGVARNGNMAWPADDWAHEYAALRSASPGQAAALRAGEGEALSLSWRDWVHTLEVSAPPARMGVHFLFPDSEMRLRGALFGHGMEMTPRNGQMVLWQGEADHAARPDAVDPTNPFGGAEGLSTRFVVEGEWARWATGWPQIDLMQAGGFPTLADRPEVAQAVAGLSEAVRRHGRLVSVALSLDLSGQGLADWPEAALAGVFLADVVNRREEAALVGVLYPPGTDVDAIVARLRENWPGTMLARWAADPDITPIPGPRPGFVLTIGGDWGEDEAASNDALAALLRARENGTLGALIAP